MLKRKLLSLCMAFLAGSFSLSAQTGTLSTQLGKLQSATQTAQGLLIRAENGQVFLSVYQPTIIRLRAVNQTFKPDSSQAVIRTASGGFSKLTESSTEILVNTDSIQVRISKSPVRFSFYNIKTGAFLSGDDERIGLSWNGTQVSSYRKLLPNERFIGLGEKTGNLDRRGSTYVNWNSDVPAYALNADPLYKTIPFYIGLHNKATYGIFFDNTHKSFFNFGASTDESMSYFGAEGGELNYYFFGASSVSKLIEDYTWLTGRMNMPPLWSLGYQQCRWSYKPDTQVLEIAKTFRDKKIPADAIYLDIDYMDAYKIFTWSPKNFSNPKNTIDQLKGMGFHVVTIVDPGIKVEKGYKQYDEGVQKGYFATYPNGDFYTGTVWPGPCHFPDFYRPEVRNWWGKSFSALTEKGIDGFWNDMNEPSAWGQNIPDLIQFGDKGKQMTLREARNGYGLQMSRATYEGTKDILGRRAFVLTRAAYAGIQRYSAVWTGDNATSDGHMLLGQRLVNSLGLSGVAYTGVDVGGFIGNPSAELMMRWNSLGVYTPMFRNHADINAPMREPWRFGPEAETVMRKDIEQRYRLLPYIYSSFYKSTQSGLPVARSLAIDYSTDSEIYKEAFQNEFLFGDNILVAPVESNKTSTSVYLPAGDWYRLSSDVSYVGNSTIEAAAPLSDLPVFVKAGGIIPMQAVVQNTSEKGDGILSIHIWNGKKGSSYVYYEDDGSSFDNEKGNYYKRNISFVPAKKQVLLDKVVGSFNSRFTQLNMVLHGFDAKVKNLVVNGKRVALNRATDGTTSASMANLANSISISY